MDLIEAFPFSVQARNVPKIESEVCLAKRCSAARGSPSAPLSFGADPAVLTAARALPFKGFSSSTTPFLLATAKTGSAARSAREAATMAREASGAPHVSTTLAAPAGLAWASTTLTRPRMSVVRARSGGQPELSTTVVRGILSSALASARRRGGLLFF
uniref:Uncharacterized protein n=1 Tax=Zea mays TaxID=4577 RepID=C4IYG9_MAIZE|nr:unknown [Zea mays]